MTALAKLVFCLDKCLIHTVCEFLNNFDKLRKFCASDPSSLDSDECALRLKLAKLTVYSANKIWNTLSSEDRETVEVVAKSYGLTPIRLIIRSYLDVHFSTLNVFTTENESYLMSKSSYSHFDMDTFIDKVVVSGETEENPAVATAAKRADKLNNNNAPAVPSIIPIDELSKLTFEITVSLNLTNDLEMSTLNKVIIPYDVLDMNHRSKGRFSAYAFCIFYTALNRAGIDVSVPNAIFLKSETMIEKRMAHAKRVYKKIRLEKENSQTHLPRMIDIDWFASIFTSDNVDAMEEVLKEIETELWYLGFFRSEVDVPQYHRMYQDRLDVFEVLTALQGHPLEPIRSRAIVLLNCFLDDHEWQSYFPLVPLIANIGDELVIEFAFEEIIKKEKDLPRKIPVGIAEEMKEEDEKIEEPQGVHLQLVAPPRDSTIKTERGYLSYHAVDEWHLESSSGNLRLWRGKVTIGEYTRCGFYDWRVLQSNAGLGSWEVALVNHSMDVQFNEVPWLSRGNRNLNETASSVFGLAGSNFAAPVQGRFICVKKSVRPVLEYKVGSVGTDERFGDNYSVRPLLEVIEHPAESPENGDSFDTILLRSVTDHKDRGPPNGLTGSLTQSINELVSSADKRQIDICVQASLRVSSAWYDRKYKDLMLLNCDNGRLVQCVGAEGVANKISDTSLLNYRDVRTWKLYLDELRDWMRQGLARGFVLEGLGAGAPVYAIDTDEMGRLDSDNRRHYTEMEVLHGKVVLPLVMESKCAGMDSWPDPLSVFLCRGIWAIAPTAKIIGETVLTGSMDLLSRSGVVPYNRSMLPILSSVLNLPTTRIPDPAIAKAEIGRWKVASKIQNLHIAVRNMTNCLVPGARALVASVSPSAIASFAHLEGKAWAYISWLSILPIELSFSWIEQFDKTIEEDDENDEKTYFLPYSLKEDGPGTFVTRTNTGRILDEVQRARSFIGSVRSGSQNPHSPRSPQRKLESSSNMLHVKNLNSQFIASRDRASVVELISPIVESHEMSVAPPLELTNDQKVSLAAVGLDTSRFSLHIKAAYQRGKQLNELLHESTETRHKKMELYLPLQTTVPQSDVISFARLVPSGSFAVCGVNFTDHPQVVTIPLNPLFQILTTFKLNRQSHYVVQQFDEQNNPQSIDVCTLLESVTGNVELTLAPGMTGLRVFLIQPQALKLPKRELYRFAFHRLVQGAKDAQKALAKNDKEACKVVARSLNSNALIVDLINSLQERGGIMHFAKYLQDTALVINDLYSENSTTGYNKFLATLLELGVFSTDCRLLLDSALRTGTPTYLGKTFSEKVYAVSTSQKGKVYQEGQELSQVLSQANGLGPIVFCTSEYGKFSTVGGLGVMIDELASTVVKHYNQEVWVISPYYHRNAKGHLNNFTGMEYIGNVGVQVGPDYMEFGLHYCLHKGVHSYFIHHEGMLPSPYPNNTGEVQVRFLTFLSKAMLETICFLLGKGSKMPELVVSNDWPTGMVPAQAKQSFGDTFRGMTFYHIVHNLDPSYEGRIWCDKDLYYLHQLNTELLIDPTWRQKVINPSRCALLTCDSWGTVSPSYRNELLGIGCRASSPLQPLLARCPDSFATPNGVAIEEREAIILNKMISVKLIPETYEVKNETQWLELHKLAKGFLQTRYFGFEEPDHSIPLCAFIGRITSQKGVHLIVQGAEQLIKRYNHRIQFLVGGMVSWSDSYSAGCGRIMLELRNKYPSCFWCGPDEFFYDGAIVNVGADISLMPSAFEPGGIVQHEFFSGGTPVLAFKTGGLRDTVHEFQPEKGTGSGWTFEAFNLGDYLYACERAVRVFNDKARYDKLRINAKQATVPSAEVAGKWLTEFSRLRRKFNVPFAKKENVPPFDIDEFETWFASQTAEEVVVGEDASSPKASVTKRPSSPVAARIPMPTTKIRYTPADDQPMPRHVAVSGGWNDWLVRHPMFFDPATGRYFANIQAPRGSWHYKVVKDGEWICNPDEEETGVDHEGNVNSILHV